MLQPTKHSHPDRTLIFTAYLLLKRLKQQRVDGYDTLFGYAKKYVVGGDILFLPALSFLYLMGLVEYHPKIDSIEYVGPNEALPALHQ